VSSDTVGLTLYLAGSRAGTAHDYVSQTQFLLASLRNAGIDMPVTICGMGELFDQGVAILGSAGSRRLPPEADLGPYLSKVQLLGVTPFEHNLFLDADCVVLNGSRFAELLKWFREMPLPFNAFFHRTYMDERATEDIRNQTDFGRVAAGARALGADLGVSLVPHLNTGAFYYRRGAELEALRDEALYYARHYDELGFSRMHYTPDLQRNDEYVLAMALGRRLPRSACCMSPADIRRWYVLGNSVAVEEDDGVSTTLKMSDGERTQPAIYHLCTRKVQPWYRSRIAAITTFASVD
jgi:hypothetical protein